MDDLPTISLDEDLHNADWTKQSWDLPPYKSAAFYMLFPTVADLDKFRETPTYKHAEAKGLIVDDEWMAAHIEPDKG